MQMAIYGRYAPGGTSLYKVVLKIYLVFLLNLFSNYIEWDLFLCFFYGPLIKKIMKHWRVSVKNGAKIGQEYGK